MKTPHRHSHPQGRGHLRQRRGRLQRRRDHRCAGALRDRCSGDYTAPLSGDLDWFVNATVQYDGKRALADQIRTAYVEANTIVDLQVGIQADAWSVQLYADNLFDDETVRWAQRYQDFRDGMYGGSGAQPRDESSSPSSRHRA